MFKSKFTYSDLEISSRHVPYQGYFCVEKYQFRHRLFQGEWSNLLTREVLERGQAAGALLFDPILDKVILIEQFRIGAIKETTQSPWLLELVAGIIDGDQTPADVARRETQEEAGLSVQDLISICQYWVSPGATTEAITLFCARIDASQVQAGVTHGLAEEGEDIIVHVFNTVEAYSLLKKGYIKNAPTIIALQWLQLHEAEVRKHWVK